MTDAFQKAGYTPQQEADWLLTRALAAKPGGSNTAVQYNDSGSFGGDANLTWDKTTKSLSVTSNALNGLTVVGSTLSAPVLTIGESAGKAFASFGDNNLVGNSTYCIVGDDAKVVQFNASGGSAIFGDIEGLANASIFTVDDANAKTTSNVKHETTGDISIDDDHKGLVLKDGAGHYWRISVSTLGALSTTDLGTSLP